MNSYAEDDAEQHSSNDEALDSVHDYADDEDQSEGASRASNYESASDFEDEPADDAEIQLTSNLNYLIQLHQNEKTQPNSHRICSEYMNKYEKAIIIGKRANQIAKNSPIYATVSSEEMMTLDAIGFAEKELEQRCIPFIIRRHLPDESFEDWYVSQLKLPE